MAQGRRAARGVPRPGWAMARPGHTLRAAVLLLLLASLLPASPLCEAVVRRARCWRKGRQVPCPKPQPKSPPLPPLVPLSAWPANLTGIGTGSKQAARPLMGWNSYNQFPWGVNETLVKQMADAMVDLGLAKLGYVYVSIDDDWAAPRRDAQKNLQAHPDRYPAGMKALTDYVHSKGLKMGIYTDAGTLTCHKSQPGSLNNEKRDSELFASWGIDYVKVDNCNNGGISPFVRFGKMGAALRATGRDMHFNLCSGGAYAPATWARGVADSWRTAFDQRDDWKTMMRYARENDAFAAYAGPGGWNDLDALEVGNGGMTTSEYRVKFSLWSMMKAPLMIGCDLRIATPTTLEILGNKEVVAINQDSLGVQGRRIVNAKLVEVWAGPLSGSRLVVGFLNKDLRKAHTISATWSTLRLAREAKFNIRSIWEKKDFTNVAIGQWNYTVQPHDIALFIFTPVQ